MSHVTSIGLDVHARSASACAFDHTTFPPGGPALRRIAGTGSRPFLWAARGPRPTIETPRFFETTVPDAESKCGSARRHT